MPGQARLSLVRESPLFRLMRGPSRHRELFAASTTFSIVDSVGPAGHLTNTTRRCREWRWSTSAALGLTWVRTRSSPAPACPLAPSAAGAARRSAPTRRSALALRRWATGEATGQYWKPVWYVLEERGFELLLVNARHVKILPGRKTDVGDAAWLCELLEHGLLRGSFVPPPVIRELRDLTRYRKRLIQTHTAEAQRIHKTLEDASIRLGLVASDVLGVSGRAMLRALLAGERDPAALAELARGRLRNKLPELREALRGRFDAHHALLLRLALEHVEQLERSIAALDAEVDRVIAPFA